MLAELQAADPRSVGPYLLLGRLGSGGMGQVYLGRSAAGRLVAVKVIRPDLAGEPGFRARFAREVSAARNVSGLFTALVVDADVSGPIPWLATLYVPGPSLSEAVASQGPLPPAAVLTLASGLAQGLQAIHAAGVVHRDLKPANVLLARDGPRVIDFGISRAAEVTETTALTQTGMVLGSPGFMSPEQAEGASVGPPSDVFSLGAVLTFAATSEGPFGTGSTPQLLYRVVHSPPEIARLPREIRWLVERCLVKDPALRPTTGDLIAALGAGRPEADWLSTALPLYPPVPADGLADTPVPADDLSDTPVPAPRLSYAPVPSGIRGAAESTPLEQLFAPPQPGDAADRRRRRDRRRLTLVTAAAAAVLAAASASAALTLDSAGGAHRSSTDSSQHSAVPTAPSPRGAVSESPHASRSPVRSGPTQQAVSQTSPASPPASPTTGTPTPTPSTPTPTPSTPTPTPQHADAHPEHSHPDPQHPDADQEHPHPRPERPHPDHGHSGHAHGAGDNERVTATDQGEAVLAHAVAAYAAALGSRLVAGYALGSLAHGGFSPLVSDVDLGLILADPPRASDRLTIRRVAGAVKADGPALHERLSVFWGTPSTLAGQARGGRFPPLDRLDLLDYGRLLTGRDARDRVARPGPAELLVAGAEFALGSLGGPRSPPDRLRELSRGRPGHDHALHEIRDPALLVSRGPRRLTKVVLFPVRFLFTAETGRVGTNGLAAEHYLARADAPAAELVTEALTWRERPPADPGAAAALVGRELIPLYLQFIDDHVARLAAAGRDDLAGRFRRWRARLR